MCSLNVELWGIIEEVWLAPWLQKFLTPSHHSILWIIFVFSMCVCVCVCSTCWALCYPVLLFLSNSCLATTMKVNWWKQACGSRTHLHTHTHTRVHTSFTLAVYENIASQHHIVLESSLSQGFTVSQLTNFVSDNLISK